MQLKSLLITIIISLQICVNGQETSGELIAKMKNEFILGLHNNGLETATQLISQNRYSDVREEALFFVAEYHFVLSLVKGDLSASNIAYTYYLICRKDYPQSKYLTSINKRISILESDTRNNSILRNLLDYYYTEAALIQNKLDFTSTLFTIKEPNPYAIFFQDNDKNSIDILQRYYDEIIVNHPDFEIYGYYYKVISTLSVLNNYNFYTDGLYEFNVSKKPLRELHKFSATGKEIKLKIDNWIALLTNKYPNHPLTLDLYLISAQVFSSRDGDTYDLETKNKMEYIIKNEKDKTHVRFMLAKEFLLNNRFE